MLKKFADAVIDIDRIVCAAMHDEPYGDQTYVHGQLVLKEETGQHMIMSVSPETVEAIIQYVEPTNE